MKPVRVPQHSEPKKTVKEFKKLNSSGLKIIDASRASRAYDQKQEGTMKRKPGSKRNTEKRSEQKKLERRKRIRKAANLYRNRGGGIKKKKKWAKPSTRTVNFNQEKGTFHQEFKIEGGKS